ncbi:MAG TPA: serpin family protein [Candidatus Limnocylindrales bacterium]
MSISRTFGKAATERLSRGTFLAGSLLLGGSIVWGCSGQAAAVGVASSQATRGAGSSSEAVRAAAAVDAFGFDFYDAVLTSGGNSVVSPVSIALALSMAQAGGKGETATQMDKVLRSALGSGNGNGINSLDQALAGLSGTYKVPGKSDQTLSLRIANAPFAQSGEQWQQAYLDTLASKYGAGIRLGDFGADPAAAVKTINGWVNDQTEKRIPKLLDSLDAATRLVLVNAIYLKAPWLKPFDKGLTADAPFTRLNGAQVSVPTMRGLLSEAKYASGSGWQAVEIPYVNTSLAMTIVLPDDLATFEKGLDAARFGGITAALQNAHVDLTLPHFKIETKSDLASVLAGMGMPLAFDPDKADFSGMTTQERLFITKVIHQANISVDEDGTEASAATAVAMAAGASPPTQQVTVKVDKPFLFAVRDTGTGAILFLGRVTDPAS